MYLKLQVEASAIIQTLNRIQMTKWKMVFHDAVGMNLVRRQFRSQSRIYGSDKRHLTQSIRF